MLVSLSQMEIHKWLTHLIMVVWDYPPGESPTKGRVSTQKDDGNSKSKKASATTKKQITNNLFATIKAGNLSGLNNGPTTATAAKNGHGQQDEDMDDMEDDYEESDGEQKLLEILEREDEDDEGGVAIEYLSGDEAEAAKQAKMGKANGATAAMNGGAGDEDDDDMMGDDY